MSGVVNNLSIRNFYTNDVTSAVTNAEENNLVINNIIYRPPDNLTAIANIQSELDRDPVSSESLMDYAYSNGDTNFYANFNDTEPGEKTWSASVSKSVLGVLIGVAEEKFPEFSSSTTIVKDNLPPDFDYADTVLDKPDITLEDLMSMKAGIFGDSAVQPDLLASQIDAFSANPATGLANAPGYFLYVLGNMSNAGGSVMLPSYLTGSAISNLQKILKNKDGVPIQMQSNNPDYQSGTYNAKVGIYDQNNPVPNYPVYSTASIDLAAVVFQVVLGKLEFGKTNNELCSVLELEGWARTNLLEPLGHPGTRLLTDAAGEVWMAGSSTLLSTKFIVELMRLVIEGTGKYNGVQIMKESYAEDLLKPEKGNILDGSGKTYFNGFWRGHIYEQTHVTFRGAGGVFAIGVCENTLLAPKGAIIACSRKSGKTTSALTLSENLNVVCNQHFLATEFPSVFGSIFQAGFQNNAQINGITSGTVWSGLGPSLYETVFYPRWGEVSLVYNNGLNIE